MPAPNSNWIAQRESLISCLDVSGFFIQFKLTIKLCETCHKVTPDVALSVTKESQKTKLEKVLHPTKFPIRLKERVSLMRERERERETMQAVYIKSSLDEFYVPNSPPPGTRRITRIMETFSEACASLLLN